MKEFKCRASKSGDLMTNGRGKDTVGATATNYLEEWFISEMTGKKKRIDSKYLSSGIARENASIERASKFFGVELVKNSEQLENDFFTGEFDARTNDMIIDVKSSWDAFTFPYFMNEAPKNYYNQLQVYMALTGVKKASLVYCLENGTIDMIDKLAWKIANEKLHEEVEMEDWDEAEAELNYDHLPDHLRIKVFKFVYDEPLIKQMEERVMWSREYIKENLLPILKLEQNEK